jgi:hypothetical protein
VAVKITYHLWVTPAEHDAIARVLSTCPTQPLPAGGPPAAASPPSVPPPTVSPTPTTLSPTPPAPGAPTGVTIVSVSSPVNAGAYASLVARTRPGAACNLSVTLPSGRQSQSSGLGPATADASGRLQWTWRTGSSTKPGTAKATVTCGAASAATTFQITG